VDVVSGYYDHTIQMQAKKRDVVAFVNMLRYPSLVLAVSPKASKPINSVADLKGTKVGVTLARLVHRLLPQVPAGTERVGRHRRRATGGRRGQLGRGGDGDRAGGRGGDARPGVLPAAQAGRRGLGPGLSDTRTAAGVQRDLKVATYPAAVLYSDARWLRDNPETARKLARAIKRALDYVHSHPAADIAAKMPPEYSAGDAEIYAQAIESAKPAFSPGRPDRDVRRAGGAQRTEGVHPGDLLRRTST